MAAASGQLDLIVGSILLQDNFTLHIKSHGASGMLDPENVVFYHPSNDKVEHTLTETWDGSGIFVTGAIGSGVSAVTSDSVLFDNGSGSFDGSGESNHCRIDLLETDKVIISATHNQAGTFLHRAVVASISGSVITYGTIVDVRTGNMPTVVAALTSSSVVFASHGTALPGKAIVGTISGLDITLGSEFQYDANTTNFVSISKVDSTRFMIVYQDVGNGSFGTAVIGEVSGATITYGPQFVYSSEGTGHTDIQIIDGSKFVITYFIGAGVFAAIGSYSGITITSVVGAVSVEPSGWDSTKFNNQFDTQLLDASGTKLMVAVAYDNDTGPFGFTGRATIGNISGTNIAFDFGFATFASADAIDSASPISIALLSNNTGMIAYKKVGSPFNQNMFTVIFNTSGTTITSTGPTSLVLGFETFDIDSIRLDDTRLFLTASKAASLAVHSFVGELPNSITLSSSNSNYPEPIGNKNIATFFWAKNPTKNNAQIKLERGYNITFASGSIALGGGNATWDNSDIQNMMDILNDDVEHSLATYFIHQSGTTWKLLTSIDGESFIDRGVQDVGSQGLLTTKTDAKVFLFDPDNENQWLDEAVLWAGEPEQFNEFSNLELFKLDGLARILNDPMPLFASASFPSSTSGDLVIPLTFEALSSSNELWIEGLIPIDSGGTLFIQGVSAEASFEKIVDVFLITADFNPTIIGSFTPPASGVTIEIWNLIGGINTQLTIIDAICFPIGDTGRFGWTTDNLPTENIHDGQYLFRMTDGVGETFVGEFFLTNPETV